MIATEKQVRIADQMYGMRDSARALFGAKWREKTDDCARIIEHVSKRDGLSTLDATLKLAKEVEANDPSPRVIVMLLMAAAVEMIEPSKD